MLSRIRDRKLVQWLIAYAAGSWILIQALEVTSEAFPAFQPVLQGAIFLFVMGLPVVLVIGWYHGEKGRQRVTLTEILILGVLLVATGSTLYVVNTGSATSTTTAPAALPAPVDSGLDTARYAVLPFRRDAGVPEDLNEDLLLHDALARWQGIDVVDLFQVRDAVASVGGRLTAGQSRSLVAGLGAGRFVSGDVTALGTTLRIHAALHDVGSGARIADTTVVLDRDAVIDSVAERLARHLLFGGVAAEGRSELDPTTTSFPARMAFLRGQEALRLWDLAAADSFFAAAARADPAYRRALLWRAQVQSWAGTPPDGLRTLVEAAVAEPERLTHRERLLGNALRLLSRGEYLAACDAYDRLRAGSALDYAAWYGLGECRFYDNAVVKDPASPSGWAFRSSYHQAVEAYRRAFELLPSVHHGFSSRSFAWVSSRLRVSTGNFRQGRALSADTMVFLARPALTADTLAFVPHPADAVFAARPGTRPESHWAAVERQRRMFHEIAESWVRAFPASADALEALALARELLGDPRALETLDRARARSEDPNRSLQIAAEKVKLLVKFGSAPQLREARALADTVLAAAETGSAQEAATLAVTAALAGYPSRAAAWAREAAEPARWDVVVPVAVTGPGAALAAYVAMGGPADSIDAALALFRSALENRIPPEDQETARHLLLDLVASLSFASQPIDGFEELAAGSGYPLLQAQAALAHGDRAGARSRLEQIARRREHVRPAELSFDAVFPEAWLHVQVGDTAAATQLLDESLAALRWVEPGGMQNVPRVASLVRAMALRAELADAASDSETARRWGTAVATLWGGGDEAVQPLVRRMRELSAGQPLAGSP